MLRFIYVCMAITVLSVLSIAGMPMIDGIKQAEQDLAQKNLELSPTQTAAQATDAVDETAMTAEDLNNISTAAGDQDENDHFTSGFMKKAPKALADVPAAAPTAAPTTAQ